MKHLLYVVAFTLLTCGCTSQTVEMDPEWEANNTDEPADEASPEDVIDIDACIGVVCNPGVVCPPEGPCPPCECCPCSGASSICEPTDYFTVWTCNDGCYQSYECNEGEYCVWDEEEQAACKELDPSEDGDCEPPFDLDPDCFECWECNTPGVSYCDDGLGPKAVMRCDFDEFGRTCWLRDECQFGDECVQGYRTGNALCGNVESEFDCDYLGCTGASPYCDEFMPGMGEDWDEECGPCGCCTASEGDLCLITDQGSAKLESRQDNDDGFEGACFEWEPCPPDKICQLDSQGRARCN